MEQVIPTMLPPNVDPTLQRWLIDQAMKTITGRRTR